MKVVSKDKKAIFELLLNIAIHLNEFDDKGIYDKVELPLTEDDLKLVEFKNAQPQTLDVYYKKAVMWARPGLSWDIPNILDYKTNIGFVTIARRSCDSITIKLYDKEKRFWWNDFEDFFE